MSCPGHGYIEQNSGSVGIDPLPAGFVCLLLLYLSICMAQEACAHTMLTSKILTVGPVGIRTRVNMHRCSTPYPFSPFALWFSYSPLSDNLPLHSRVTYLKKYSPVFNEALSRIKCVPWNANFLPAILSNVVFTL